MIIFSGYWMFHCHFESHLLNGMVLIIEVGERSEMKRPPPDFPRCGVYLPRIKNLDDYGPPKCHCSDPACSCGSDGVTCHCGSMGPSSDKKSCSCKSCGRPEKKKKKESSTCHCSSACSCGSSGSTCHCPKPSSSKIDYGKYKPNSGPENNEEGQEKYIPPYYMP